MILSIHPLTPSSCLHSTIYLLFFFALLSLALFPTSTLLFLIHFHKAWQFPHYTNLAFCCCCCTVLIRPAAMWEIMLDFFNYLVILFSIWHSLFLSKTNMTIIFLTFCLWFSSTVFFNDITISCYFSDAFFISNCFSKHSFFFACIFFEHSFLVGLISFTHFCFCTIIFLSHISTIVIYFYGEFFSLTFNLCKTSCSCWLSSCSFFSLSVFSLLEYCLFAACTYLL